MRGEELIPVNARFILQRFFSRFVLCLLQVLFKKLVTGDLSTRQLVRMTPDQLASEELAEWREKTMKKELDMIKEVAIEEAQMNSSGVIRKMTYKGEVEIERQSEVEQLIYK